MRRNGRFRPLLCLLLVVQVLGCGSDDARLDPSPSLTLGSTIADLLYCQPLAEAADTQVVGPSGGSLTVGPHRLTIPAGALSKKVTIIAQVPSDTVNSIRLLPHGLTFPQGKGAKLELSYKNCTDLSGGKRIAYVDEGLHLLEYLPSVLDVERSEVEARLGHFSRYAVAY